MNWLWDLTGGRPMIYVEGLFIDTVNGFPVVHYRDRSGRHWMAQSQWALFRVPYRWSKDHEPDCRRSQPLQPGAELDQAEGGWNAGRHPQGH
jgi:hypothetical protein